MILFYLQLIYKVLVVVSHEITEYCKLEYTKL